jgi:hypothetical protein
VLRVTPPGGDPWDIAIGSPGWSRTPVPTAIAFVSDAAGYIVDVVDRRVLHEIGGVARIREDELHDLLLMATASDLVAIGAAGIVWRTQIAWDDVKVTAIDGRGIHCTGYDGGMLPTNFLVDAASGKAVRLA